MPPASSESAASPHRVIAFDTKGRTSDVLPRSRGPSGPPEAWPRRLRRTLGRPRHQPGKDPGLGFPTCHVSRSPGSLLALSVSRYWRLHLLRSLSHCPHGQRQALLSELRVRTASWTELARAHGADASADPWAPAARGGSGQAPLAHRTHSLGWRRDGPHRRPASLVGVHQLPEAPAEGSQAANLTARRGFQVDPKETMGERW